MITPLRPRAGVTAAYCAVCVVWSTTWIAIKVGLHGASPLIAVGLRSLVAGACFASFALAKRRPLRVPRDRWRFVALTAACVFTVPYATVYLAETQISSGLTAVLSATLPIFSALFARRLLPDEPLTARRATGIAVGVVGVAVVFHGGLQLRATPLAVVAAVAVLVGPAFLAAGQVVGRRESGTLALSVLLAWSMLAAGGLLLAIGLLVGPRRFVPDLRTLGSLAYLALAGSVLGFGLLYWLLARIRAVSAALLTLVLPILALLEGWGFYSEPLNSSLVLGSIVVAAGIGLASLDPLTIRIAPRARAPARRRRQA